MVSDTTVYPAVCLCLLHTTSDYRISESRATFLPLKRICHHPVTTHLNVFVSELLGLNSFWPFSLHCLLSLPWNASTEFWALILSVDLLVHLGQHYSFTLSWRPLTFSFIVVVAFLGLLLFHTRFLNELFFKKFHENCWIFFQMHQIDEFVTFSC